MSAVLFGRTMISLAVDSHHAVKWLQFFLTTKAHKRVSVLLIWWESTPPHLHIENKIFAHLCDTKLSNAGTGCFQEKIPTHRNKDRCCWTSHYFIIDLWSTWFCHTREKYTSVSLVKSYWEGMNKINCWWCVKFHSLWLQGCNLQSKLNLLIMLSRY